MIMETLNALLFGLVAVLAVLQHLSQKEIEHLRERRNTDIAAGYARALIDAGVPENKAIKEAKRFHDERLK